MILESLNGVHKDVDDLYGDQFTVALARAATTLECAPYWHSGEKAPARLTRAIELVRLSRVTLQDDRLATVHGSTKAYDVTGFHCTCPQSQKGQSSWCVHAVAVKLARTMAAQAPRKAGHGWHEHETRGTTPLPLPPVTVDERLAAAAHGAVERALALSTMPDSTALSTNHTPQEDMMADEYIPEPDNNLQGTTAVLEPPRAIPETRPLPGPVLLPSLDARTLEQSMQAWSAQRQVVKRFLQTQLIEGTDYYSLKIGQRETKPTLSKAGSEKFLGLFQLHASFAQDDATWTMLGKPEGTLCYVCHLMTRSGEIVGEGRGARRVSQDNGDINKAVKMAQKSATIDAVLRTGALSEAFTQDLEPDDQPTPVKPTGQEQRQRIWHMVQAQAPEMKTREQVETWIKAETSYTLHPDNYANIIVALEARA